ncbi:hypothetical protein BM1374165_01356 [Bartonella henselae]|uniref:Uncharacterized protein n=1 Tax=Bartonella henselae TaxID=38323 RepID=X5MGE0_BARHN|nr:hypothetical protein BM1374165_01356 [Bartonella henselae]
MSGLFLQIHLHLTIAVLLIGAALALSGMIMHWHSFCDDFST